MKDIDKLDPAYIVKTCSQKHVQSVIEDLVEEVRTLRAEIKRLHHSVGSEAGRRCNMTPDTAALVRQMREALADRIPETNDRRSVEQMRKVIASADKWLAQQRGPLTDEEIARMWKAGYSDGSGQCMVNLLARAIERAHGIGQEDGDVMHNPKVREAMLAVAPQPPAPWPDPPNAGVEL